MLLLRVVSVRRVLSAAPSHRVVHRVCPQSPSLLRGHHPPPLMPGKKKWSAADGGEEHTPEQLLGGAATSPRRLFDAAVRVCFKRSLSAHLVFLHCMTVDKATGWFEWVDACVTLVEKDPRDAIKVGDVVRLEGEAYTKHSKTSPSGSCTLVEPTRYTIIERWAGGDALPAAPRDGNTGAQQGAKGQQKRGSGWADPRDVSTLIRGQRRMPAAILMCNGHEADRLALYFDGAIAVNTDSHRSVYIFDSDASPNIMWRRFVNYSMAKTTKRVEPPGAARGQPKAAPPRFDAEGLTNPFIFLHSVILRIIFVTEPVPFVTHEEAYAALAARRAARLEAMPSKDEFRKFRVVGYPRDLEKRMSKGAEAVPKREMPTVELPPVKKPKDTTTTTTAADSPGHKRAADAPEALKKRKGDESAALPAVDVTSEGRAFVDAATAVHVPDGSAELHDHVCLCDGVYWVGVDAPRMIIPEHRVEVPSGAYWKLLEVRERYLKVHDGVDVAADANTITRVAAYDNRAAAIDVGASPGGWSLCCSTLFNTDVVFAVDPAEHMHSMLAPRLVTGKDDVAAAIDAVAQRKPGMPPTAYSGKIVHLHMKGQEAVHETLYPRGVKLSIYVCDINHDLEVACELAEKVAGISRECGNFVRDAGPDLFERPALVVLTFKNNCRSMREFNERKARAKAGLAQWLSNMHEIHLFANSALETTVVGEVL